MQARTVVVPALDWLEQISNELPLSLRGALARRSNLDRSSARRPEIASLSLAMTIELDGGQHAQQEQEDAARTLEIARRSYRVIRF
jgi:hypothetical protein